jgi:hypothetical protein
MALILLIKEFLNSSGAILSKTRSNVSADGISCGSSKNCFSHSYFVLPNSEICSKLTAFQITAHIEIVIISINLCCLLFFLGSNIPSEWFMMDFLFLS